MDDKVEFEAVEQAPHRIVYVKPVAVADLPKDVQSQAMGATSVYAVHAENGECLAVVRSKNLAFVLARQHDMAPVHVH